VSERERQRAEFLTGAGWGRARLEALPGDASARRYFRLADQGRRAMLMDAPPPEDVGRFVRIARLLHRLDYSAPLILAADPVAGFLVLEDLGEQTYTRLIEAGGDEERLYGLATDLLADLHRRFDPALPHDVPAYSDEILLEEAGRFVLWFLPAATGAAVPERVAAEFAALWRGVLPLARAVPDSLVLRDYHIDNLMLLDGRAGLQACGLLDFQDAVIGPIAYDLVSLVEDARRDVSAPVRGAMVARYLAQRPGLDAAAFEQSLAVLGAQRHTKVIGLFCRLCLRDGKSGYLRHLPRLWRLLEASLAHPALGEVERWMSEHVPAPLRRVPPGLGAARSA
jgi:aminoglycoside/choline kinase family phosphotransferase